MDCTTLRTIDKVKHSVTDMSFISFPPEKGAKDSTLMLGLSTLEMDECKFLTSSPGVVTDVSAQMILRSQPNPHFACSASPRLRILRTDL